MSGSMMKTEMTEHKSDDFKSRYMNSGAAEREYAPAPATRPAVKESVSYGEDQGGLRDWFHKLRTGMTREEEEEEEIQALPPSQRAAKRNDFALTRFAKGMSDRKLSKMEISEPTLVRAVKHDVRESGGKQVLVDDAKGAKWDTSGLTDPAARESELKYQEFLRADDPTQLAHDPAIRQRAMDSFTTEVQGALAAHANDSQASMLAAAFRGNGQGMKALSQMLRGTVSPLEMSALYQFGNVGMTGVDPNMLKDTLSAKKRTGKLEFDDFASASNYNQADFTRQGGYHIIEAMLGSEESEMGGVLDQARAAFDGSNLTDEDMISGQLMSLAMNRAITPTLSTMARADQEAAREKGLEDPTNQAAFDKAMNAEHFSNMLMAGAHFSPEKGLETSEHKGFMTSLRKRWRKKQAG